MQEEKIIKIYLLTNQINNKIYVGQTQQDYKVRMNNGNGYKRCLAIHVDIQKYGVENFVYTTLTTTSSRTDAKQLENSFMDKYDSRNPAIGYNINAGGAGAGELSEVGRAKLQRPHSKETIEKRRKTLMDSQEIQDQVVEAYKSGKTIKEIKAMFNFGGNGRVYRILAQNKVDLLNNFTRWTGKQHTEETKEKMSQARTKYWDEKLK